MVLTDPSFYSFSLYLRLWDSSQHWASSPEAGPLGVGGFNGGGLYPESLGPQAWLPVYSFSTTRLAKLCYSKD